MGYLYDVTLRSSAENRTSERGHSTINNHKQMTVLLEGLKALQTGADTRLDNVWITINGVRRCVKVVVPILYFMNDAKEGDMFCCRVAGHHPKTRCHSRVCDMEYDDMLDLQHTCTVKQPDEIEALVDAGDTVTLNAMSQYCIQSCFRGFVFCNPALGIFGGQPGDMLHMYQLGLMKLSVKVFFDNMTVSEKTQLDDMGRRFNKRLKQCHRRHFPRTDFSRGITNTKQKTAEEYTGLLFVLCALINNQDAWELIDTALSRDHLEITGVLQLFECMLCFDRWCKQMQY